MPRNCYLHSGPADIKSPTPFCLVPASGFQRFGKEVSMKRSTRQPKTISEQLGRHLNVYAAAASATGVSLLALAQPADAKVVFTPAQVTIAPNSTYNLDLNND